MMNNLDLNGTWQLRWNDGERGDRIGRILAGQANWDRAWPASVPGSVHGTLIELGVIPDPDIGAQVLASRWVESTIWYYRRTFSLPAFNKDEHAWLIFENLDLAAKIHLNGVLLGTHHNAFRPCRLDATNALREGENELVVEIESGLFHARNISAEGMGLTCNRELTKMPWLRKSQNQHAWDWSPRLLNVGIPGDVRLETFSAVRCESITLRSDLSEDLQNGRITVRAFVENHSGETQNAEWIIRVQDLPEFRKSLQIAPGRQTVEEQVDVANPELWWPVGHGPQACRTVEVELKQETAVIAATKRRIGFRHVGICQKPHPETGHYFYLEINGKPIFCKGGNYVPGDLILSRMDADRHAILIDRALEAGCNFLRVWGGGVYESDDFYELCDARGILVWQDFVFACAKYPTTDPAFLEDITEEARHQIRRLAHHPSLIIWCGNNEMEWAAWEWGFEKGVAHPDYAFFHMILPRLMKTEDPGRYYQPSSPFSPDHEPPNANSSGDQHPWSIGFSDNDFRKYREMICRFPNEGGILGPNSLPTVRDCLAGGPEQPGTFAWELHDNSLSYWDTTPPYAPDHMLEQWLGRRIGDMSVEDYVYWAGLLQGAGLAEYIKNFRRRMFDSGAAVFWMFNDIWPCTRSWTIVDHRCRRTPAFWPVRRAFAPITTVVTREDDQVRVYGINEGAELQATLRFGLLALEGTYPKDETISVRLAANASTLLAEFPADLWDQLGIDTHVAFALLTDASGELARDCLILPYFREMKWPQAEVEMTVREGKAVFSCDRFVWRVCLDLDGEEPLSDNFFDIFPGIPTTLDWPSPDKPTILRTGTAHPAS